MVKESAENVRQGNNSRLCLFPILLPDIPLPFSRFLVAACRAASLRENLLHACGLKRFNINPSHFHHKNIFSRQEPSGSSAVSGRPGGFCFHFPVFTLLRHVMSWCSPFME